MIFSKEFVFQVVLHALVFVFYSFDRRNQPHIAVFQLVFFLNYAIATLFVSYYLLPHFYYKKRYLHFFAYLVVVIIVVMLMEEFVLEQIYFPDSRGQRFYGFYTLVDVLPVITILSGFKFAWDALGKQREVDELKAAVKESELQFLKSQINPHFLFNNLNNLYSYAVTNSAKTPVIILELSSVLRYMLYECKEEFVSLTKEIKQLENFTRLNELQIEERGEVNFKAPAVREHFQIAPLILIVFIENAFKHSQASQSEDISIDILVTLSEEEGRLDFYCSNNFRRATNTAKLSHGIGLENVKKRLQLMYPNAHQLDIREGDSRYEVHLSMQLTKM